MSVSKYPNLEAERARRGLTKSELAEEIGISRKTYCAWITTGNIPQSKINMLCDYFGLSADYLLGPVAPGICSVPKTT